MGIFKPFQLLEITIISAQDLEPKNKKMHTYATAWINPARKLTTIVDREGGSNPTWNDKFVFRVDEEFLRGDTSAVQFEIYSVRWFRDSLIGTVRLLVGNLIPPPARPSQHQNFGMRFAAVQVRRPSGRPQGILNIGVAVLDSSMRSMPLYQSAASAVGYRDLMEEDDLPLHNNHRDDKPVLRRSRSDRSEFLGIDNVSLNNSSLVAVPRKIDKDFDDKASSILSTSFYPPPPPPPLIKEAAKSKKKNKGFDDEASSILSISMYPPPPLPPVIKGAAANAKKGKASSMINGIDLSEESKHKYSKKVKANSVVGLVTNNRKPVGASNGPQVDQSPTNKMVDEKPSPTSKSPVIVANKPKDTSPPLVIGGPRANNKLLIGGGPYKANSILSDSEVGPSPSEVAAAMAERPRYPLEEERSSVLDGWSLDESVEGLRSKLERWRTELPPLYDRGYASSSFRSSSQYTARRRGEESGAFSCFGNIFGYECQCICGKPPDQKTQGKGSRFQSPSSFL